MIHLFEVRAAAPLFTTHIWSGVLAPINADGSSVFKAGRAVPVKYLLTGEDAGSPISS
jgi:hypothetical protein